MKMFADQQIDVGAEVISYLVNRMERSFEAARLLVDRLNNASLATKRRITVPLAREVIQNSLGQNKIKKSKLSVWVCLGISLHRKTGASKACDAHQSACPHSCF